MMQLKEAFSSEVVLNSYDQILLIERQHDLK
jgi:hypothetical protein